MTKQTEQEKAVEAAKVEQPKPRLQIKTEAPIKKEPSIYIGPALQGGRLARYTIFKGGELTPNIKAIADEHRSIKRLIVPVSRLAESEKRLADPSSVEAAMFAQAAKIFSKGGK